MIQLNQNIIAPSVGTSQTVSQPIFGVFDFKDMKAFIKLGKVKPSEEDVIRTLREYFGVKFYKAVGVSNTYINRQGSAIVLNSTILHKELYYYLRLIKPYKEKVGYYTIRKEYLHRIIAKTFIENPKNKPEVNHINGIKTDNRLANLEWVTKSEQQKHAYSIGLNKCTTSLFNDLQVSVIKHLSLDMMQKEIANIFNTTQSNISRTISGDRYENHLLGNWKTTLL